MSGGIELLSADGTPVLDVQSPVLEVRGRGTTRLYKNAGLEPFWIESGAPGPRDRVVTCFPGHNADFAIAGAMENDRAWALTDRVAHPEINLPGGGGVSDTIFYQPGTTRIGQSYEVVFDTDIDPRLPTGVLGVINQAGIPYAAARPTTPGNYAENYGMQIHSEQGQLLFDSRADHLAIRYAFILPKSTMDAIISGTQPVVDVSLPEPLPNAWIAAPLWVPFQLQFRRKWVGNYEYYRSHIQFSQIGPSTIRFERFTSLIKTYQRTPYTYTHDAIFYLARSAPPVT